MKKKKTSSILRKFLLFNLSIFSVLGLFTIVYLNAIQPNLVKKVSASHFIIINNTSDHIERLGVEFNKKGIKQFLLSTRFLFQGLDRVQFFNLEGNLVGDTNMLDLDQTVFSRSELIIEQEIDSTNITQSNNNFENKTNYSLDYYKEIKNTILNRSNSDEILQKKLINIPILVNETGNVIEFNSSFSKELKIDKQRSFWDLLKNNEKKSNNN